MSEATPTTNLADLVLDHLGKEGRGELEYVRQFDCVGVAIQTILDSWKAVQLPQPSILLTAQQTHTSRLPQIATPFEEVETGGRTRYVLMHPQDNLALASADAEADLEKLREWRKGFSFENPHVENSLNSDLVKSFFVQLRNNQIACWSNGVIEVPAIDDRHPRTPIRLTGLEPYAKDLEIAVTCQGFVNENGLLRFVPVDREQIKSLIRKLLTFEGSTPLITVPRDLDKLCNFVDLKIKRLEEWLTEQREIQRNGEAMRVKL